MKTDGANGLSYPVCRGGRLCPPSKFVEFSWSGVGADAHIGPLKCYEFASDFRKNGQFRRADRVVRPYGAKSKPNAITSIRPYGVGWEINTVSPENRHKIGAFGGPMWASTPTGENETRCDSSRPVVGSSAPTRGHSRLGGGMGRCRHRPLRCKTKPFNICKTGRFPAPELSRHGQHLTYENRWCKRSIVSRL